MKSLISTILLFAYSTLVYSQITVTHFNANWNDANKVSWVKKLSDVDKIKDVCIAHNPEQQKKHEIVVVPTIIIFKDGEEVKRYQADISFTMVATREEVQDFIDELIMSDF
tara:strand:+ start:50 stop:382 length:333 start_codon:yes stop_codon:yes gene_type:complete